MGYEKTGQREDTVTLALAPEIAANRRQSSHRKFSGDVNRSGSLIPVMLAKNSISLETLASNFVSSHVKTYCLGIATAFVDSKLAIPETPLMETPDSGKELATPLSDTQLPKLMPSADSGFAAVVMADVSGYSKLSSKLAEKGPIGAELLGKAMKGYLDQVNYSLHHII